ncbi:MAG: carbohydrate-binding protein [Kiritimatiellia bacterium]|jgi:hypothetical protein
MNAAWKACNLALAAAMVGIAAAGWIAASAKAAAHPPRQRISRSLTPEQIADWVTNAPPQAKVSAPVVNMRPWTNGASYAVSDPVTHDGAIYLCILSHTALPGWTPAAVPALWRQIRAKGETMEDTPVWRQPLGAHDAYPLGAKVQHNGKTWESIIAANVWQPGVYGWIEVTQGEGETMEDTPAWKQPLGAHDAYPLGAKVQHNGKTWESIIAANVWQPGVYGWTEVTQ